MDAATDSSAIMQQLDAIRAATLRRLDGLTQAQLDWRPPGGTGEAAWSLGEVFMHLAIDEYYLGDHLGRLWLEGVQPPDGARSLPLPPYGVAVAEIRQLFADTRTRTRNLIETWQADSQLPFRAGGDGAGMNGADWLAAYGEHEASHQQQIDTLLAQSPGGADQAAPDGDEMAH
jgi:hypothetical protein